jgi:amidase
VPDPSRERNIAIDFTEYTRLARERGITPLEAIPDLAEGIRGLERFRQTHYDAWLAKNRLDALVFPTLADVAPADADTNPASAAIAWRNGTWVANGNLVIRHLGIPTVTVPMGNLADIGMPIGLTFAARPYEDATLLRFAYAFEQAGAWRETPPRTPPLPGDAFPPRAALAGKPHALALNVIALGLPNGCAEIEITADTDAPQLRLFLNGSPLEVTRDGRSFTARQIAPAQAQRPRHSEWRGAYGHIILAVAEGGAGLPVAEYRVVDGVA